MNTESVAQKHPDNISLIRVVQCRDTVATDTLNSCGLDTEGGGKPSSQTQIMGLEDNTTAEFDDIPETADTETIQDDNSAGSMETPETANTGIMETNDFSRWSHVTHWQKATCRTY